MFSLVSRYLCCTERNTLQHFLLPTTNNWTKKMFFVLCWYTITASWHWVPVAVVQGRNVHCFSVWKCKVLTDNGKWTSEIVYLDLSTSIYIQDFHELAILKRAPASSKETVRLGTANLDCVKCSEFSYRKQKSWFSIFNTVVIRKHFSAFNFFSFEIPLIGK